jgi:hypothetical protein
MMILTLEWWMIFEKRLAIKSHEHEIDIEKLEFEEDIKCKVNWITQRT